MISKRYQDDRKPWRLLSGKQVAARASYLEKVKCGQYRFEEVTECPCCRSVEQKVVAEKDRFGISHRVVVCPTCGLIFTNPRLNQAAYADFYASTYTDLYHPTGLSSGARFALQLRRGYRFIDFLKVYGLTSLAELRVLEVGCGAGGVLKAFAEQGAAVEGCDLGSPHLDYGRKKGLNVINGSISDITADHEFDLIIYSHVFEHVLDLKAEFELVKRLLRPDGSLLIEVPGIKRLRRGDLLAYLEIAHVYHFSRQSLRNILSVNGFSVVADDEGVVSLSRPSAEVEPIKNDYKDVMAKLKSFERTRAMNSFLYETKWRIRKLFRSR